LDDSFKCALGLSGTVIGQLGRWEPGMLDLFREVAHHPNVEVLGQTYYHSVACLFDDLSEFEAQVQLHQRLMYEEFGVQPQSA
jgi:alpha-amylase